MSFWEALPRPFIALAPMDGVTDAPFRHAVARQGGSAFFVTEFTNVEGLSRGAASMLEAFLFSEAERPVIGQLYGTEIPSFRHSAMMLAELGFDGVDINMGCPAKKVANRGAGAGLIQTPELAKSIILEVKNVLEQWANGKTMEEEGVRPKMAAAVRRQRAEQGRGEPPRRVLPVSAKTRLGIGEIVVEDWVGALAAAKPVALALHGRTLKQMYTGRADWDAIARGARILRQEGIVAIGNGDIQSRAQAKQYAKQYGLDGILIGRGAMGHPSIFASDQPQAPAQRASQAIAHADLWEQTFPQKPFFPMRRHLLSYCQGFPGSKALRVRLCQANSAADVRAAFAEANLLA